MSSGLLEGAQPDNNEVAREQSLPAALPVQSWAPLGGRARGALHDLAGAMAPITLTEVMSAAALQTRVDKKFLLSPEQMVELVSRLGASYRVLEIDQKRIFGYESVYFDTPDLAQFRAHRQGRRRRYKARTRLYVDSNECMFEAKLKSNRGETVKYRWPHSVDDRGIMTRDAHSFLAGLLEANYAVETPILEPVLQTDYSRCTFVDPVHQERLTCDIDLVCKNQQFSIDGPDMIIVETKSATGRGTADQALLEMGVRPLSMSKYCLGIAMLNPELAANKWSRLLARHFGWQRASALTGQM